jgi:hypothetical protein
LIQVKAHGGGLGVSKLHRFAEPTEVENDNDDIAAGARVAADTFGFLGSGLRRLRGRGGRVGIRDHGTLVRRRGGRSNHRSEYCCQCVSESARGAGEFVAP